MTIFSLADTRFPIERANGVQTMQTCHALARRGHVVTLMVRPDSATPSRDPFAFYGVPPCASLLIEPIATSGPESWRRARMLWAGLVRALSGGHDVVFTRDLGLAALLCRWPRHRRPALVYESHGIAPVVAQEMPRLLGAGHAEASAAKLSRLDRREALVWRKADGYVTLTRALADDLRARYGARTRVDVVADGATLVDVPPPPSGPLVAAYAGHLYPWKGVDVFIRALADAPQISGLIVGGHPGERDRARVEALVRELGLGDRVTFTGLLPPHEVTHVLARASILVLPNTPSAISDRYTSPLKLFEYLVLGRAIVASDLPSLREVLTDDASALLVPAGDAGHLARALRRLGDDGLLRARLGAGARTLAPRYTWEARATHIEAVCQAAVAA